MANQQPHLRYDRDVIVQRLRGQALIDLLTRDGHHLKRVGAEHKMICPFHDDKSPSMGVNANKAIIKCFACGAGYDPLGYIMVYHRLDFKEALAYAANALGIAGGPAPKSNKGSRPAPAREVLVADAPYMTAMDVLEAQKALRERVLDPQPWIAKLFHKSLASHAAEALARIDGFFAPVASAYTGVATPALIVAMRDEEGGLISLRFRSMVKGSDGRAKRWSLDVKEKRGSPPNQEIVQVKQSRSGLMLTWDFLNPDFCLDDVYTFWIEGETDLWASTILMLRDYGEDEAQWPARWLALPGVESCHDMAMKTRLSATNILFFDGDQAGMRAAFDHRRTRKNQETGRMELNMELPREPGLLSKLKRQKLKAGACFPQKKPDGGKHDLRDMVNDLMRWHDVRQHMLATMTTDPKGPLGWQKQPSHHSPTSLSQPRTASPAA